LIVLGVRASEKAKIVEWNLILAGSTGWKGLFFGGGVSATADVAEVK